jgi:DhnA family fructose-bisphosphate aldolase class Ia
MIMTSQMGKEIRISKLIDPEGRPAIVVKADEGLSVGPVEGLEKIEEGLRSAIDAGVDGMVLGPGQASRMAHLFRGKAAPAMLVRSDWSNVRRDKTFPLPWKRMTHVTVAGARHAAFLGAHAVVASFFVGYRDDQDEADNIEALSRLGADCFEYGLPLLAEAVPIGERITDHNFVDSAKMAGRMSLEAGADAIAVPFTGSKATMKEVVDSSGEAPVFLITNGPEGREIKSSLKAGISGIMLDSKVFRGGVEKAIEGVKDIVEGVSK